MKPISNHKEITFAGFTGDTVPSYGTFKIPFIIQNKHYFEHDFHVVPNTTDECILCLDFMYKYGILFNGQTGSIFYNKKNGIIRPSSSPYGSPCLLVAKKDGSTRFVVDYRKLNSFTIRDRYPLPRLDESIESFFGAKYFTTLDLLSGYHQIEVDENDKPKTAFTSELGHYEYNRMPLGLTNAPATFQRLMNFVLQKHLYKIVVVYLDDIIIFSKTFARHRNNFCNFVAFTIKIKLEKVLIFS